MRLPRRQPWRKPCENLKRNITSSVAESLELVATPASTTGNILAATGPMLQRVQKQSGAEFVATIPVIRMFDAVGKAKEFTSLPRLH